MGSIFANLCNGKVFVTTVEAEAAPHAPNFASRSPVVTAQDEMARFLKHHNRVIFAPLFFRQLIPKLFLIMFATFFINTRGWDKYEGGQIYSVPWLGARVGSGHQFTSLKVTSYAPLLSI
ncbi:hypothetical protein FCM35_KLT15370 [Carex littledalei]|uniref:Uncharacterized protein n=1 Tax=Carex littledalei TaxID=544730 RepID=A0A833W0X8_9POAL|nr:hypothetical protein FCM35_KLT15370 [Carex littledalei]